MATQLGRPTVITPATVRKLEQALRDGLSISQACFTSGVGRTAYYNHLGTNEAFANKMELARVYVTIKAKQLVVQEIHDGNLGAAKWWLERKAKDEFGPYATNIDEPPHTNGSDDLKELVAEMRRGVSIAIAQAEAQRAAEAKTKPQPEPLPQPQSASVRPVVVTAPLSRYDVMADLYED